MSCEADTNARVRRVTADRCEVEDREWLQSLPTVSMGLSPIMAIYQGRFNRCLENGGLKPPSDQKIWTFLGDGEIGEPESLGAIAGASREYL